MTKAIVAMIQIYRYCFSYFLTPGSCRFYPTCSNYALEAVSKYGPVKGVLFSMSRLLKCRPGIPGGVDLP